MYLFLRSFGKFLHDLSSKRDVRESIACAKKLIQTTKISEGTSTDERTGRTHRTNAPDERTRQTHQMNGLDERAGRTG